MAEIKILPFAHEQYPKLLRTIPQPPTQLYIKGNSTLLNSPCLAVVGSRAMTNYGQHVCEQIVTGLVQNGIAIVSGLACGIDAVAHRTALQQNGNTIAVLAHGLNADLLFPKEHARLAEQIISKNGALISEYPYNTVAKRYFFPARNRIIAGLCLGTVVIEARQKSGALITAAKALDMNREVFAVPGSIFSSRSVGTHALLRQGAILVETHQDILAEFPTLHTQALLTKSQTPLPITIQLSPDEKNIINTLESENLTTEQLLINTGFSAVKLTQYLTELEIKGIVRRNVDFSYSLC